VRFCFLYLRGKAVEEKSCFEVVSFSCSTAPQNKNKMIKIALTILIAGIIFEIWWIFKLLGWIE